MSVMLISLQHDVEDDVIEELAFVSYGHFTYFIHICCMLYVCMHILAIIQKTNRMKSDIEDTNKVKNKIRNTWNIS